MRSIIYIFLIILSTSCTKNIIIIEENNKYHPIELRDYAPTQKSEFDIAKTILVHEPSSEILPGMLHPQAALFDIYFNIYESQKEHQNYVEALKNSGADVIYIKDALMLGSIDSNGETIEGKDLDELRAFAQKILNYDTSALSPESMESQEDYKAQTIKELSVEELVDILIMQPTIILKNTEFNTGITATYQYNPLMNLFYTRDQMITTAKGIIISKMNSPQRQNECEIMIYALRKLGIEPIYQVAGDGAFLEGGDLLSYPNISFIGCGMRTTKIAIDQLLERDLFGTDSVVVVYDKCFSQAEMHLDTYFNIIDSDLATMSEARKNASKGDLKYSTIDIYSKEGGKYVKTGDSLGFVDFLENQLGITLIPITESDQARLAGNFLTVAPREIMAVANQSYKLEDSFKKSNVKVHWIELENLIKGYGAAHCMTQVIERY